MELKYLLLSALISFPFWFIVFYIKARAGKLKSNTDRIKEDAIRNGRVLQAPLVNQTYNPRLAHWEDASGNIATENDYRHYPYKGLYRYTINGMTYNKWISFKHQPPAQLTFYWQAGKPNQAFSDYNSPISMNMVAWSMCTVFTWIILYWILYIGDVGFMQALDG